MISAISKDEYMQMYQIIGAALEVHNNLGRGLEEALYQEALQIELEERDIRFDSQKKLQTYYKGHALNKEYYADLICYDSVMVELKAVSSLNSEIAHSY